MSQNTALRSLCVSRIAPVIAALTFTFAGADVQASTQGQAAIVAKLATIPGAKTDILKAKSTDLVYAVALVLEDSNNTLAPEDIAASALEAIGGKARADKDKIAGQIVAQAIASAGLVGDGQGDEAGAVVKAVFGVNSTNPKTALKSTGQAAAVAAGLQAVGNDSVLGNDIGAVLVTGQVNDPAGLLVNIAKSLGKNTSAANESFKGFTQSLVDDNNIGLEIITTTAQKVAASNPTAAGSIFGGFIAARPLNDATAFTAFGRQVVTDKKLAKAYGEILAQTLGGFSGDFAELTGDLIDQNSKSAALISQGVIRAASSTETDEILGVSTPNLTTAKARASFAGIVAVGTGDDTDKVNKITSTLVNVPGQTPADQININTAIVNALGTLTPDAAFEATNTTLANTNFSSDTAALGLGTSSIAKVKSTAAAGYVAKAVVDNLSTSNTVEGTATNTAAIMAKNAKAATDIARRVAELGSVSGSSAIFAEALAGPAKKFVLNIAVGISLTDTANSAEITKQTITHDNASDKSALAKTPQIAGAVATAVHPEQASLIGAKLTDAMSVNGVAAGKPIKLSLVTSLAKSLAKAIQTQANVSTKNRADELGEIAAVLTHFSLGKNPEDAKGLKAQQNQIIAIGKAVIAALSKKVLNAERTLKADLNAAEDIAGSIAQTIQDSTLNAAIKSSLLDENGALQKALVKAAGKTFGAEVATAFQLVRSNESDDRYETGTSADLEALLNDPETDNRDA